MMRIAIVDDEERMLAAIQEVVKQSVEPKMELEIYTFTGATQMLKKLEAGQKLDILLADIELAGMNGIELGRIIRKMYPDILVVFLTSHPEFAAESYAMNACQYVLKQDMEQRLPLVLMELMKRLERKESKSRLIGTEGDKERIDVREIICIHKDKGAKYISYVTVKGVYRERLSIEKAMVEWDSESLVRADRGCVVNLLHMIRMKQNIIYMKQDVQVAVSRSQLQDVKKRISQYFGGA